MPDSGFFLFPKASSVRHVPVPIHDRSLSIWSQTGTHENKKQNKGLSTSSSQRTLAQAKSSMVLVAL